MTAEQIDNLARKRELLPDNVGLAARNLYHSLVMLYKEYRDGIIDADSARKEKKRQISFPSTVLQSCTNVSGRNRHGEWLK